MDDQDAPKQLGTGSVIGLFLMAFLLDCLGFALWLLGFVALGMTGGVASLAALVPIIGVAVAGWVTALGLPVVFVFMTAASLTIGFIGTLSFMVMYYLSGVPGIRRLRYTAPLITFALEFILPAVPGWTGMVFVTILRAKLHENNELRKYNEEKAAESAARGRGRRGRPQLMPEEEFAV